MLGHFVRLFMYTIRWHNYINYILLLAMSCFGNHVGNFFWSINRSGIWSSHLWSIRHENDDWPNFFSHLAFGQSKLFCFQWRLTKSYLINHQFGQSGTHGKYLHFIYWSKKCPSKKSPGAFRRMKIFQICQSGFKFFANTN